MADEIQTQTEVPGEKLLTPGRIVATLVVIVIIASVGYQILFDGPRLKTDSKATLPVASNPAPENPSAPDAVKPPPDYVIQNIDGGTFRLSEFRGKVVVMDFWATWCPPCQAETPELVKLAKQYGPQGVTVVGLHIDDRGRSSRQQIRSFAKTFDVPYTIGLATDDMFVSYLGTQDDTIPQTLVFGRDGKVVAHLIGFDPSHASDLENAVKRALAG